MYAIVKTGGKQYRVASDDIIEVEKLSAEPGEQVELDVAFIADGSSTTTDADALLKAKVFATVLEQFKGDKQIIFKFKKRKGYKRLKGHRQNLTRLHIDSISLDGKAPKGTKKTGDKAPSKAEKDAKSSAASTKIADLDETSKAVTSKKTETAAAEKKATASKKSDEVKTDKPAEKKATTAKTKKDTEDKAVDEKPAKKTAAKKAADDVGEKPKAKAPKVAKESDEAPAEKKTKKKSTDEESDEKSNEEKSEG